jgi:phospholipase A-2-activating protein
MDVDSAQGDWRLSAELLPEHEGGVQAVAALSDDLVVSGGDDSALIVWRRDADGRTFSAVAQVGDHTKAVRAILPLPPRPGLPGGGFATGSLDGAVRVYSLTTGADGSVAVMLLRTLTGHLKGVISLSLTSLGDLVSGGWEGHVRVWDLGTWACKCVLEGHENGTCVVGLPNGDIAVGSTGRKSEDNRHVDYKLRLWKLSGHGSQQGYSIAAVLEDHEQAVRDVGLLPDGAGFVSVANDGCVKVRGLDGAVRRTFVNPASDEGKPFSAFRVAVARGPAGGESGPLLITANEDEVVRVIDLASGDTKEIKHPGACVRGRRVGKQQGEVVAELPRPFARTNHLCLYDTTRTTHPH